MDEFEKVTDAMETEEKEILNEQATLDETTENIEAVAETGELTETEETSEEVDEFSVADEEQAPKKQFIIERTIIKAACIFLATLVVFLGVTVVKSIMTQGIEGVWIQSKAYYKGYESQAQKYDKDAKCAIYYQFAPEGALNYCSGTISQKMKWSYSDKNGKAVKDVTEYVIVYSDDQQQSNATPYKWSVKDNKSNQKVLKLTMTGQMTSISEFDKYDGSEIPEYKMPLDKNFKVQKEFVGNWADKKTKQYLTLNEDGSYVLNINNSIFYKGNYTVDTKKKIMNLKLVADGNETSLGDLPYTLKDNKLTLAKYEFTKTK